MCGADSTISATLQQWLTWAQVDLDKPMDAQPEFAQDPHVLDGSHPPPNLRTWGLELVVRVLYYNHGLASKTSLASRERSCILEVRADACFEWHVTEDQPGGAAFWAEPWAPAHRCS